MNAESRSPGYERRTTADERRTRIETALNDRDRILFRGAYPQGYYYVTACKDEEDNRQARLYVLSAFEYEYGVGDILSYDDDDGFPFEGLRIGDDLRAIGYHVGAVIATDRDLTPITTLLRPSLREKADGLHCFGEALDMKDVLDDVISTLRRNGFSLCDESQMYETDKHGNIIIETNIIQTATGSFITHPTCKVCGRSAGFCLASETLKEAERNRDSNAMCMDCWVRTEATCKNCTNYGVCIEDEGKPVINAVDCEDFEAETDDIDDEVCSCPL